MRVKERPGYSGGQMETNYLYVMSMRVTSLLRIWVASLLFAVFYTLVWTLWNIGSHIIESVTRAGRRK